MFAICYIRLKASNFSTIIPTSQQQFLEYHYLISHDGDINWELKNTLLSIDESNFISQKQLTGAIDDILHLLE